MGARENECFLIKGLKIYNKSLGKLSLLRKAFFQYYAIICHLKFSVIGLFLLVNIKFPSQNCGFSECWIEKNVANIRPVYSVMLSLCISLILAADAFLLWIM